MAKTHETLKVGEPKLSQLGNSIMRYFGARYTSSKVKIKNKEAKTEIAALNLSFFISSDSSILFGIFESHLDSQFDLYMHTKPFRSFLQSFHFFFSCQRDVTASQLLYLRLQVWDSSIQSWVALENQYNVRNASLSAKPNFLEYQWDSARSVQSSLIYRSFPAHELRSHFKTIFPVYIDNRKNCNDAWHPPEDFCCLLQFPKTLEFRRQLYQYLRKRAQTRPHYFAYNFSTYNISTESES